MTDASLVAFFIVVGLLMLAETWRSRDNEAHLRRQGATEPADDVYRWMQVVYPASFLVMAVEGFVAPLRAMPLAGTAMFVVAKSLKYWAIGSLGRRWSFRVLVPPRSQPSVGGPYRWVRHPNYVAVALELVSCALFAGAWRTGPIAIGAFVFLMWRRIAVEERALGLR